MFLTLISLIILLPLVILQENEKANQYSKFDYCTLNCGKDVHSACNCAKNPPRSELHNVPYMKFRKIVLDEHNKWRNYIASGNETRPQEGTTPPAANMVVMNYDLEMEYISRCRALKSYSYKYGDESPHDTCRPRQGNHYTGQNLYGTSQNDTDELLITSIQRWYNEVEFLTTSDIMKSYKDGKWGHFGQVVWWSADRVGCTWVHNPENSRGMDYSFFCNYASTLMYAGPVEGVELYKISETACDGCPNGTKCGETEEYSALCGKQEPIPDQPPALIPLGTASRTTATKVNNFAVYFVIVILYLTY